MSTKKVIQDFGRQYVLSAVQKLTYEDAVDGTLDACEIAIPEDAVILSGRLIVTTAFNTATSAVLDAGWSADPNGYLAATNLKTTGQTDFIAGSIAGVTTSTTVPVTLAYTGVGAVPTTGEAYVVVEYVVKGRANENQD